MEKRLDCHGPYEGVDVDVDIGFGQVILEGFDVSDYFVGLGPSLEKI